ncbi:MAG: hypothetical protein SynsKO_42920 [Synoicihabitans sp.]
MGQINMTSIKIVGVYPVLNSEEPCHMIEMAIYDNSGVFPVGDITQRIEGEPRDNWQAPYAERIVSADGETILTDEFEAEDHPDLWEGDFRLVFFFHQLDPEMPLISPFEELPIPSIGEIPLRLSSIVYEAP